MYNTLRRIREEKAAEDRGFTLIELLVVVVIIGILVAIAIPLYLNYRHGAENRSVQSDIRNAVPSIEQYYATNNSYPAAATWEADANVHVSSGNTLSYKTASGAYFVCGTNSDTGSWYTYSSTSGQLSGTADGSACS